MSLLISIGVQLFGMFTSNLDLSGLKTEVGGTWTQETTEKWFGE